jgi:2-oxoglutarate dehydrogenase dihydrolipoamide succinyltransferase (E2 component)
MKQDMLMPKMGESITEGTIIRWLKKEGEMVDRDEIILEISTDKVDSEIPTPVAGKIVKLLANEGDTVEVGTVIAQIDSDASATAEAPAAAPAKEEKAPEPAAAPTQAPAAPAAPAAPVADSNRFYSPVVLNIARTEGISQSELDTIPGTGINGRVSKKDVLNYLEARKGAVPSIPAPAAAPAPAPSAAPQPAAAAAPVTGDGVEVIPMDHIRKKIAEHMVHTVHTSPHVSLYVEVDMHNIDKVRGRLKDAFKSREGFSLTYMPFICDAITKALKNFPMVNSSIEGDNILVKHFVNLGIAVAADQGLIVPVIKNADSLNLTGLARGIYDLATRARNRKLKPEEVTGGTFSISNFGVYGTTIGFPLINQPQVAILGVGAVKKKPVVIGDAIGIRPMMNIALTFDHRLIDGAMGAQFLQFVQEQLENFDPKFNF